MFISKISLHIFFTEICSIWCIFLPFLIHQRVNFWSFSFCLKIPVCIFRAELVVIYESIFVSKYLCFIFILEWCFYLVLCWQLYSFTWQILLSYFLESIFSSGNLSDSFFSSFVVIVEGLFFSVLSNLTCVFIYVYVCLHFTVNSLLCHLNTLINFGRFLGSISPVSHILDLQTMSSNLLFSLCIVLVFVFPS